MYQLMLEAVSEMSVFIACSLLVIEPTTFSSVKEPHLEYIVYGMREWCLSYVRANTPDGPFDVDGTVALATALSALKRPSNSKVRLVIVSVTRAVLTLRLASRRQCVL